MNGIHKTVARLGAVLLLAGGAGLAATSPSQAVGPTCFGLDAAGATAAGFVVTIDRKSVV